MSRMARVVLLCFWLLVCVCLSGVAFPATKKPLLTPVKLNSGTAEQLQQVPGIGPATADKILQMRKSHGAFKSVDDLLAVRGIGRQRLDKMRRYLTVGKPATTSKPAAPAESPALSKPAGAG
jgi:competence protein ComEA